MIPVAGVLEADASVERAYSFSQISDYLIPGSTEADQDSMFRYVAHVDEVELLIYPSPQFVHTRVPLDEFFIFLLLSHARQIATIHGISAGSRCTTVQLRMLVENHSCTKCHTLITVFRCSAEVGHLQQHSIF